MNVLDLFSGIGGFSLGLERAGFHTVAFCERDDYCRRVLAKHWPDVPIHPDIKELDGTQYRGTVDLVCGGFPCQRYSTAARGRNNAECLWPEFARIVAETRPRFVVAENVNRAPWDDVERDLYALGYQGRFLDVALPFRRHERSRTYCFAYTDRDCESVGALYEEMAKLPEIAERYWEPIPALVGVATGPTGRLDRMKMLGNSVLVPMFECFGRVLASATP